MKNPNLDSKAFECYSDLFNVDDQLTPVIETLKKQTPNPLLNPLGYFKYKAAISELSKIQKSVREFLSVRDTLFIHVGITPQADLVDFATRATLFRYETFLTIRKHSYLAAKDWGALVDYTVLIPVRRSSK